MNSLLLLIHSTERSFVSRLFARSVQRFIIGQFIQISCFLDGVCLVLASDKALKNASVFMRNVELFLCFRSKLATEIVLHRLQNSMSECLHSSAHFEENINFAGAISISSRAVRVFWPNHVDAYGPLMAPFFTAHMFKESMTINGSSK